MHMELAHVVFFVWRFQLLYKITCIENLWVDIGHGSSGSRAKPILSVATVELRWCESVCFEIAWITSWTLRSVENVKFSSGQTRRSSSSFCKWCRSMATLVIWRLLMTIEQEKSWWNSLDASTNVVWSLPGSTFLWQELSNLLVTFFHHVSLVTSYWPLLMASWTMRRHVASMWVARLWVSSSDLRWFMETWKQAWSRKKDGPTRAAGEMSWGCLELLHSREKRKAIEP